MNPKFRALYLILGFAGLLFLVYHVATSFPDVNPGVVLLISVPDLVVFFLAYKTYPMEAPRRERL